MPLTDTDQSDLQKLLEAADLTTLRFTANIEIVGFPTIVDANDLVVAAIVDDGADDESVEARGELIVASVNALPELLALRAAAEDLVAKVERGEMRSKRSYAAFKAALALKSEAV